MYDSVVAALRKDLQLFSDLRRVAVQTNALFESAELVERVQTALSEAGHNDSSVFLLARTDQTRVCPDENQARYYKADLLIQVGPKCRCDATEIPCLQYESGKAIDVTDLAINKMIDWFDKNRNSSKHLVVLLDSDTSIDIQKIASSEIPSFPLLIYHWQTGLGPQLLCNNSGRVPLLKHWTNEDCSNVNFSLLPIFSGVASAEVRLFIERHFGCFEMVGCRPIGLAAQRYAVMTTPFTRVGILVNERLTKSQNELRRQLKQILRSHQKVVVQIAVNPYSEAKLENFSDCDIFVFVGCDWQLLQIVEDSKNQRRKIVAPFEILVCLGLISWTAHFIHDVHEVLEIIRAERLVDKRRTDENLSTDQRVALLPEGALLVSGGQPLVANVDRTFQGVEREGQRSGDFTVFEGRKGVASAYVGRDGKS